MTRPPHRGAVVGNGAKEAKIDAGNLGPEDILEHVLFRYFDIPIIRQDRSSLRRYHDIVAARPAFREHVMVSFEELRVLS